MRTFTMAVAGVAIGLIACSTYTTSVVSVKDPARAATVSVSLPSALVSAGQSIRGTVVVKDASGVPLANHPVTWSSSASAVATVDQSGLIAAVAAGTAVVSATSDGVSGQSTLTVTAAHASVSKVTISLNPAATVIGQTAHATVAVLDSVGNALTDRTVTFTSANTSIATVSATGDVSAVAAGTTNITATSEGKSGSASFAVSQPAPVPVASVSVSPASSSLQTGSTTQLTATTRDANNNVLTGRTIGWSSSNPGIATVSNSGLVTGVAAGNAQINASSEGQTGSASITVTAPAPAPVATVSLSPSSSTLNVGATVQITATTRDANNNVLTGRVVTWSSGNNAIATVSSSGLVTAVAAGSTQVTATSEGKSTSATITVNAPPPVPVASVSVSPSSSTLDPGVTVQLSATTRDANNNVLTGRVVTWSSGNTGVATVSANGLVTAGAAGSTQVTATSEGKSASATITVNAPPPPPPPGGSVEPSGMTMISDRPFNSTTATYTAGEDGWWDNDNGALTIIQDATAPKSPNNVAQMTFSAGIAGGYAPSTLTRDVSGNTVYVAAWVKYSSNWQSHNSSVNKILHFWIGGLNRLVITAAGYQPYGPLTARISLQQVVSGGNNNDGGVTGTYESTAQFVRGQWTKIEVIAVGNSPGANDGSVKLYINGTLATQCSGIQFYSGGGGFQQVSWAPVWGGTGDVVSQTMYEYMDHIYISSK